MACNARKRAFSYLLFAAVSCASAPTALGQARIQTGADLERTCNSTDERERRACDDYAYLNVDFMRKILDKVQAPAGTHYCYSYDPPAGLAPEQAGRIVRDWLRTHRDRGEIAAGFVVDAAMRDAFPCKK